jgi:prepilin-type N-terminal cleavage/methylation domain-containing protein
MMKRNEGFTLVELLVVLAIMAILATFVGGMVINKGQWVGEKVTVKLTETLSETRTNALAKTSAWMMIKYDSGKYILSTSYTSDVELGTARDFSITFDAKDRNGSTEETYKLSDCEGLVLTYNRGSGAFSDMYSKIEEQLDSDGKLVQVPVAEAGMSNKVCTNITIWQDDLARGVITLYPETGKYTYKVE